MIYSLTIPMSCVAAVALTLLGGLDRAKLKQAYQVIQAGGTVEMMGCSVGAGSDVHLDRPLLDAFYPWRYDGKWSALTEKLVQLAQGYCVEISLNPQDDVAVVCVE